MRRLDDDQMRPADGEFYAGATTLRHMGVERRAEEAEWRAEEAGLGAEDAERRAGDADRVP